MATGNIPRKSSTGRERMRSKIQSGRFLRTAKMDATPRAAKGTRRYGK